MSMISNTYATYETIGIREELSDVIYNISPTDTPVMSNGGRGTVDNTKFEWQTDALAAASTSNAVLEGDDISTWPSVTPTVRLHNYCQISRKLLIVSGTTERVRKAGRKSELAYQMALRSAELKRDMEATITSNQGYNAGGDSTARQTATLLSYIKTNVVFGVTGANPTGDGSNARTDGTQRAATEDLLKNVAQLIYTSGGKLDFVSLGPVNKQNYSAFAGIALNRREAQGDKPVTVIGAADVYVSDYGNVNFVPNRFQRERDALFLDSEMYSIQFLRPFFVTPLAKTGDAEKRMLLVEWGLQVNNEKALGLLADQTTTIT